MTSATYHYNIYMYTLAYTLLHYWNIKIEFTE